MRKKGQRLGQHFLNAQWVSRDLVASLAIKAEETILEIGPGRGALTTKLLETGSPVVAIEKDPALVSFLKEEFVAEIATGRFTLIENDIRSIDLAELNLGNYVVAANIPYYITGEILRFFLENNLQPRAAALLIQKEVAERVVARDGKESILSLSVKAYGSPSIVAKVPAGCFSPPPSVDSAILLIENISRDFFSGISEETFFKTVKVGFSSKRKMLAGNLTSLVPNTRDVLEKCGIAPKARAEDVPLEKWGELARLMHF
jgi:16S rRNA (adenine1518-N6/adenine1519-N6)-dimethyltransferase